jgi:hypothetical protein
MRFTFYNPNYLVRHQELPGIKEFLPYFKVYGRGIAPVDRSGCLKFPVRTKSLFPLPRMRPFPHTYEEVCNARAVDLLTRADHLDTSLYAFWSGGIDSTCVLVSLLKNADAADRERIVVLMSEESIAENPGFYRDHIRGKLKRKSASLFPYILGSKNLIVNGEHNDQLFGSDIIEDVVNRFGFEAVQQSYSRELFLTFFEQGVGEKLAPRYVAMFEQLSERAPIRLSSNYSRFWWINFTVKWQTVYMRMLSFIAERNAQLISASYLKTYYAPFYNTEAFQLWSMNNLDQRLRNGWRSYKWPAKEVIYKFTGDAEYRDNKVKRGSLQYLVSQQVPFNFIDDQFAFHTGAEPEDFYERENCFR